MGCGLWGLRLAVWVVGGIYNEHVSRNVDHGTLDGFAVFEIFAEEGAQDSNVTKHHDAALKCGGRVRFGRHSRVAGNQNGQHAMHTHLMSLHQPLFQCPHARCEHVCWLSRAQVRTTQRPPLLAELRFLFAVPVRLVCRQQRRVPHRPLRFQLVAGCAHVSPGWGGGGGRHYVTSACIACVDVKRRRKIT